MKTKPRSQVEKRGFGCFGLSARHPLTCEYTGIQASVGVRPHPVLWMLDSIENRLRYYFMDVPNYARYRFMS